MRSLEGIRGSLPPDAALVEYFSLKDQFIAAIVTREGLEVVPLTPVSRVVNLLRLFHFQIAKFKLGADYTLTFEQSMLNSVQTHLRQLYDEVLAPLRSRLSAQHLIIVPHGVLHYLPFHALFDGTAYTIDSFTISYAPSASVFAHCQEKRAPTSGGTLILVPIEGSVWHSCRGCLLAGPGRSTPQRGSREHHARWRPSGASGCDQPRHHR